MESENRKTTLFALATSSAPSRSLAGGVLTGSSALLAGAAHSTADCLNPIFLLVSLSLGKRRPEEGHPFGHGKERFFWAVMAAVMIFVGGAIFSIVQGALVLRGGQVEHDLRVGFVVFAIALVFGVGRTRARRAPEEAGLGRGQAGRAVRPSVERVMDELQRDVRGAVTAVQQVFIDPTPTRGSRATAVAVAAM